jgi:hypothetical protein
MGKGGAVACDVSNDKHLHISFKIGPKILA